MPTWSFALGAFAAIASLGTVIWMLVRGSFNVVQYRLTICLISFALSTISCVLFAVNAELKAGLGYATIALAGPGVVWVAVIVILTHLWSDPVSPSRKAAQPGWIPFSEWRFSHGKLNYLFTPENMQYCIKEVFNNVFFRYPEKCKLSHPAVQTVFVYYPGPNGLGMIKLQRVSGQAKKVPIDLYHVSAPSLPGKDPSSYLFLMDHGSISAALPRGAGDETWHSIHAAAVDSLVVAHCPDGNPPEGDYLWIDVPKYTCDEADVAVTFLGKQKIADTVDQESRLWEVTHSAADFDDELTQKVDVPVAFMLRFSRGIKQRSRGDNSPMIEMQAWMTALDSYIRTTANVSRAADARAFLLTVRDVLREVAGRPEAHFSELFGPANFPHMCQFAKKAVRNPMMALVHWEAENASE